MIELTESEKLILKAMGTDDGGIAVLAVLQPEVATRLLTAQWESQSKLQNIMIASLISVGFDAMQDATEDMKGVRNLFRSELIEEDALRHFFMGDLDDSEA